MAGVTSSHLAVKRNGCAICEPSAPASCGWAGEPRASGRELGDDEKVKVLRAYLRKWGVESGIFFEGTGPKSSDDKIRAIAPKHPAFEVLPASASPPSDIGPGRPASPPAPGEHRNLDLGGAGNRRSRQTASALFS